MLNSLQILRGLVDSPIYTSKQLNTFHTLTKNGSNISDLENQKIKG